MIRVPKVPEIRSPAADSAAKRSMWLISFTDLISLMLAFFVLMFSMGEPQVQRFQEMAKGLSARSMATRPSDAAPVPSSAFNAAALEPDMAVNLDYLGALLRSQMAGSAELSGIEVRREDDRVVIGLPGALLFQPEGAGFSAEGRRVLYLLGAVVGRIGNRIEVVGRAEREDVPAGSAWERALGRAAAVAMALRETGVRRDLVARATMSRTEGAAQGPAVDIVVREGRG